MTVVIGEIKSCRLDGKAVDSTAPNVGQHHQLATLGWLQPPFLKLIGIVFSLIKRAKEKKKIHWRSRVYKEIFRIFISTQTFQVLR